MQLNARTAIEARRELAAIYQELATDYLDVVTYYYVESQGEWDEMHGAGWRADELAQCATRWAGANRRDHEPSTSLGSRDRARQRDRAVDDSLQRGGMWEQNGRFFRH